MNRLKRLPPPPCLDNSIEENKMRKIEFYKNLRDKKGHIRPRWNTAFKEAKLQLLKMSNYFCAYCGDRIDEKSMDIDHYLPKEHFGYLAYSWINYLPSCKKCNQSVKQSFTPKSIKGKKIIDLVLQEEFEYDYIFDDSYTVHQITQDRLIDPSYDNPEDHLEFNPEFFFYEAKTRIGELTNNKFFAHKEVAEKYEEISNHIKDLVFYNNPKKVVTDFLSLHGFEYVGLKFYEYWLNEKNEGRIAGR